MKKNGPQYFDYLNVPVGLCLYSLQTKKTNQVKFFLYLKSISSGYVQKNNSELLLIASHLDICYKTLNTYLQWLLQHGWLIPDPIACNYRIIGFNSLTEKLGFTSSTGALLYKNDIPRFKSFAVAAVIAYLIERIRVRQWQTKAGLIKGSPNLSGLPTYPSLPHMYLAKTLKLSKTSAYEYRKLTVENKFLKCYKIYENLGFTSENFITLKKYYSENPEALRKKGKQIYIQLPDKIESLVYLRTKSNIRVVCQRNRMRKNPDLFKRNLCHEGISFTDNNHQ